VLTLGIETATPQFGLALRRDSRTIGEFTLSEGLRHCERLIIGLDGVLADLGLAAADIDGVAVSTGPGSFTGIRIGVAAAQGLAMALTVPIVGVSTLAALAAGAAGWHGPLVACLDARRGEVYFCAGTGEPEGFARSADDAVLPAARVAGALPWPAGERILVVGDAAEQVAAELTAAGHAAFHSPSAQRYPRPAHVAMLGARALAAGRGATPEEIEPLYLRRSDAELSRERTTLTRSA
jgi:tRNA threonylcarbamoyladenosine biosynthesis protein TsaB